MGIPLGTMMAARSGYRAPFLLFALTMAVATLLIWRFLPQPEVERMEGRVSLRLFLSHYARMVAAPRVMAAAVAFAAMFLGASLYVLYLPTWLEAERGFTPGKTATLFAIGGIATVVAGPSVGRLSDRVGRRPLLAASSVGYVVLTYPAFVLMEDAGADLLAVAG